jgi:predicted RNase H-like HicB family nuclease
MTEKFLVVYEWSGRNFGGFAPDVPGCGSTGRTLEEIRKNLREGIQLHLQSLAEENEPLPHPVSHAYVPDAESEDDLKIPGYYYIVELLEVNVPVVHQARVTA